MTTNNSTTWESIQAQLEAERLRKLQATDWAAKQENEPAIDVLANMN
jgi:hypothetical protein